MLAVSNPVVLCCRCCMSLRVLRCCVVLQYLVLAGAAALSLTVCGTLGLFVLVVVYLIKVSPLLIYIYKMCIEIDF